MGIPSPARHAVHAFLVSVRLIVESEEIVTRKAEFCLLRERYFQARGKGMSGIKFTAGEVWKKTGIRTGFGWSWR